MLNGKEPEDKEVSKLFKYTNHADSHELDNILAMFYHGVYTNMIGIMQALNQESGQEELILVGIKVREDGTQDCFPLAKVLKSEEVGVYAAPDGEGGWAGLGKVDATIN